MPTYEKNQENLGPPVSPPNPDQVVNNLVQKLLSGLTNTDMVHLYLHHREIIAVMDIGFAIHRNREHLGISRRDLAGRLNISEGDLLLIEEGRANITVTALLRLSKAFGTSLQLTVTPEGGFALANVGSTTMQIVSATGEDDL